MSVPNTSQQQPLLICSADTAKLLNISQKTLFTLTKQGVIPAIRVGRRSLRYSVEMLRDLIDRNALAAK